MYASYLPITLLVWVVQSGPEQISSFVRAGGDPPVSMSQWEGAGLVGWGPVRGVPASQRAFMLGGLEAAVVL